MSTTSSLLTPTDLSPARPFDPKLNSAYEFGPSATHLSPSSLLLDPGSPNRLQDILPPSDSPSYSASHLHPSQSSVHNLFPSIDRCTERPAHSVHAFYNSIHLPRRSDLTRGPLLWRQQQRIPAPFEWARMNEDPSMEHTSGLVGTAGEPLRSSLNHHYPTQGYNSSSQTHEVSSCQSIRVYALMLYFSQSIFSPYYIRRLPRRIISLLLASSSRQISRHPYFFSRSSKLLTLRSVQRLLMPYVPEDSR
jgi:hypothetical protein